MSCDKIITITRQFGSGGHEIGEALAKKLEIPFYDKELISLAAKESGVCPEVFEEVDERATNSLLYSLSVGLYNYGNGFSSMGDLPVNDRLYILQHKIINSLSLLLYPRWCNNSSISEKIHKLLRNFMEITMKTREITRFLG